MAGLYEVIVQDGHTVQAGRDTFSPGSIVPLASLEEAERLVGRGVVAWIGEPEADGDPSDIPEDFPGRAALIAAGFTQMEQVFAIDDFDEIDGIGQATETKIVEALDEMDDE